MAKDRKALNSAGFVKKSMASAMHSQQTLSYAPVQQSFAELSTALQRHCVVNQGFGNAFQCFDPYCAGTVKKSSTERRIAPAKCNIEEIGIRNAVRSYAKRR